MKIKLSKEALKFVQPNSPRQVKLMAASGSIPLNPKELVVVLYVLCTDKDVEIKKKAIQTLRTFSKKLIVNVMDDNLHPGIIDFLVRYHVDSRSFYEKAVFNKNTSEKTILFLASLTDRDLLELIISNQERLLQSRLLYDTLIKNEAVSGALRSKLVELVEGRYVADSQVEKMPVEIERQKTEDDTEDESEDLADRETEETPKEGEDEESQEGDDADLNLDQKIRKMSVAERIRYASLGNKEARTLLLRDASRTVIRAVMNSPKLTEEEVIAIAKSKQSNDEAVRMVTRNKEWMKIYAVKHGLVSNPKTPTGIAMRLIPYLNVKDIKEIAKSKNVPGVIANTAKKALQSKEKKH
ncbi:MAG: hypothetical protein JW885_06615 [Deltaproteobacteria bacterium]|nr:hypothetical protein [Candidatus Zymogenaceae bacterium]